MMIDMQAVAFLLAEPGRPGRAVSRPPAGTSVEDQVGATRVVGPPRPGRRLPACVIGVADVVRAARAQSASSADPGEGRVGDRLGRGGPRPRVKPRLAEHLAQYRRALTVLPAVGRRR